MSRRAYPGAALIVAALGGGGFMKPDLFAGHLWDDLSRGTKAR